MKKNNIFRASEVNCYLDGWIVDLSSENFVNADCQWNFPTKKQCENFVKLLKSGVDIDTACHTVIKNK